MLLPEYDCLDAIDLAALVRRGEVQPRELVEAAIERIERRDPATQRRRAPPLRARARGGRGAVGGRAAARRAVPAQGPVGRDRRRAAHRRLPLPARFPAELRRRGGTPLSRRRPGDPRPHQHARAGARRHHRAAAARPDAQPVGPRALGRRQQRRLGGRGGGAHGADGGGRRRRRLDPHPGRGVCGLRPQADARPHAARPRARRGLERPRRPARAHPHGTRQRAAARRLARRRAGRPLRRAAGAAVVPGAARPAAAEAAHRGVRRRAVRPRHRRALRRGGARGGGSACASSATRWRRRCRRSTARRW